MGTYNGLYRLGSLAGMLVGALLADLFGADSVSISFGIVTLLALPFVIRHVSAERVSQSPTQVAEELATSENSGEKAYGIPKAQPLWKNAPIIWTLLTGLLLAMLYQGVFTATVSYLMDQRIPNGMEVAGIVIGAATVAGVLQALRWGWEPFLAPWFGRKSDGPKGRRPLFVGTLVVAGLLFAAVPLELPFAWWLVVLLVIQLTSTVLTTVMDALASDVASQSSKVAVITAYTVAIDLGAALGPFSGYLVEALWGTTALYLSAGVVLLLLALRWGKSTLKESAAKVGQIGQ